MNDLPKRLRENAAAVDSATPGDCAGDDALRREAADEIERLSKTDIETTWNHNVARCTVVGYNSTADANQCLVIGDDCHATTEAEEVIGTKLFGQTIPDDVREHMKANPRAFEWFLATVGEVCVPGPNSRRTT